MGGPAKTYVNSAVPSPTDVFNPFATDAAADTVKIYTPHPADADLIDMDGFYVGENYPQRPALNGNTTWADVVTTISCDAEASWDDTEEKVIWTEVTPYGLGTSDVYMVAFGGSHYLCDDMTTAEALGLGLDGNTGTSEIYTYTKGFVHFVVWLNQNGVDDYSILRNQFVHLQVNGVTGREFLFPGIPGDPVNPDRPIPPTDPQNPDPDIPTDPVDGYPAYLEVQVTVNPWTYKVNSTILGE